MSQSFKPPKVALLVGGLGTRLRSVLPSTAKPMAAIGDKPFLELLLRQLASQGFREIVLCTGYRSADIESQLGDGSSLKLKIEYSHEATPMGTAGALKLAETLLRDSTEFVAMNGDSFMELDFRRLVGAHQESGGIATLAAVRMQDQTRYGTVDVDPSGRIIGFREKTQQAAAGGLVNAGVYVFSSRIFDFIPAGQVSLEKDVFPRILSEGFFAVEQNGIFIDIGTPEDFARAQVIADRLNRAASTPSDKDNPKRRA